MFFKTLFCLVGLLAVSYAAVATAEKYVNYPELKMSYKMHTNALAWGKAREKCLNENAVLATPKTESERNTIKKIFEKYPYTAILNSKYDILALGLHDLFHKNEFLSELGFSIDYFYRGFDHNQPDQHKNESCLYMERNGLYHNYPCEASTAFICQIDHSDYEKKMSMNTRGNCNSDIAYVLDPVSRKRYKLHTDLRTWGEARTICFAEGGNLAVIRNKQEETFLTKMLNWPKYSVKYGKLQGFVFLGVHDMFIEGQFVTAKGENLKNVKYERWAKTQPNGGTKENCVGINITGELNDLPCDVPASYLCEI